MGGLPCPVLKFVSIKANSLVDYKIITSLQSTSFFNIIKYYKNVILTVLNNNWNSYGLLTLVEEIIKIRWSAYSTLQFLVFTSLLFD